MKDDLESLAYFIIKLCIGELSWESMYEAKDNKEYKKILYE